MASKTIECKYCGNTLKESYYPQHILTKKHILAVKDAGIKFKHEPEQRAIYRNINNSYRKTQVQTLGKKQVNLNESFKKFNQRLVLKGLAKITMEEYLQRNGKRTVAQPASVPGEPANKPIQPNPSTIPLNNAMRDLRSIIEKTLAKNKGKAIPQLDQSLIKQVEKHITAIQQATDCDDFKQQMVDNNKGLKNAPSKASTDQYVDKIRALHNKMFKTKFDCTDYSFLKDSKNVIDFIENKYTKVSKKKPIPEQISFQTKKAIYTAIVTISKNLGYKDILGPYDERQLFYSNKSESRKELAQLDGDQKKNYVDYNVLQKAYAKKYPLLESREEKMIADLFVLTPSRRLDWRTLEIVANVPSNEGNYLLCSLKGKTLIPTSFIFNAQKNKLKNTETWKFDDEVFGSNGKVIQERLQSYIAFTKKKPRDLLFSQLRNQKKQISSGAFGDKLRKIMEFITGKPFSSQLLRISFENWFQAKNPTYPQRIRMSKWMNHSVDTALSYAKT
jgi:hypothetical protein